MHRRLRRKAQLHGEWVRIEIEIELNAGRDGTGRDGRGPDKSALPSPSGASKCATRHRASLDGGGDSTSRLLQLGFARCRLVIPMDCLLKLHPLGWCAFSLGSLAL